ncbi:MAG: hypothetical protein LBT19_02875 [Candidatus Nomurabacteria bacterium]|nr:hypothetical protein [Candidatus Nomurabacteria bacterium]
MVKAQNKDQKSISQNVPPKAVGPKKLAAWEKLKTKNDVAMWERNNFDKIVFYATGKDFWQATMNSCLSMVNLVHEQLNLNSKIHSTLDYYLNMDRIFTSYHQAQIERMRTELPKLGMRLLRDEDDVMVFQMAKSISPEMLGDWAKVEEIRKKKLDAYLMPVAGSNQLYVHVRELGRYTVLATDKMRDPMRVFAAKLIAYLDRIYELHIELDEAELLMTIGKFAYVVQILNDEKIIDDKKAHRIGFLLHNIRKEMAVGKGSQVAN